jgi:hypothetical protein
MTLQFLVQQGYCHSLRDYSMLSTVVTGLRILSNVQVQVYDSKTRVVKQTFSRFKDVVYGASFRCVFICSSFPRHCNAFTDWCSQSLVHNTHSNDGKLIVAGGEEGIVRIFEVNSKTLLRQLKGHQGYVIYYVQNHSRNLITHAHIVVCLSGLST